VYHKLILNFILNSGENAQINRPVTLQTDHPKLLFFSCFHFVKLKIIWKYYQEITSIDLLLADDIQEQDFLI